LLSVLGLHCNQVRKRKYEEHSKNNGKNLSHGAIFSVNFALILCLSFNFFFLQLFLVVKIGANT
jgi:hypothetical protein